LQKLSITKSHLTTAQYEIKNIYRIVVLMSDNIISDFLKQHTA